ncbi:P-loop containing nucleoside triphosphate hydrolase protein [Dichotomopilus funicola]|uniref:P-loop containing nucleoside triphosphate hydrolase protein n=1 Tax=Dichotomopilus funicola TaxID=1934379 RepID=A0AAN6UYG8_9PEZI|nr:P-loop containing nucleoside triphosphate hydrolase protein [Dichotomopilus funicola]
MDPVSALSVAGVALQLAGLCVSVPQSLANLKGKYDEASKTISNIKRFCATIELAARHIQEWLETTIASSGRPVPWLDTMMAAFQDYTQVVQDLKDDIDKIIGPTVVDEKKLGRRKRLRFVWNQDLMGQHLQQLHYLSSALHLLLDATRLQFDPAENPVHWSRLSRDYAESIASVRHSVASLRDAELVDSSDTEHFAFSEILKSSKVYQRAASYSMLRDTTVHHEASGPSCSPPSDTIPGTSPPPSRTSTRANFRPPQNPLFFGRQEILDVIYETLLRREHANISTCTLHGPCAIGKTQIANEYGYRHSESGQSAVYHIIWHINAESPASIAMSYSSIVSGLGLTSSSEPALHMDIILECLRHMDQPWLLVFDNFDPEMGSLHRFLPESTRGHGSVLVTSRKPAPDPGTASIEVSAFTLSEATQFLLQRLDRLDASPAQEEVELASAAADALGCLPLALDVAATCVRKNALPLSVFLEEIKTTEWELHSRSTYSWSLNEAFYSTVAGLSAEGTAALQLLAFLYPDGLDEDVLLRVLQGGERTGETHDTPRTTAPILEELVSSTLVRLRTIDDDTETGSKPKRSLSIHRITQSYVRSKLDRSAAETAFQRAALLVRTYVPDTGGIRGSSKEDLSELGWVLDSAEHVAMCYTALADMLTSTMEWVALLLDCAGCRVRTGHWQEAKKMVAVAANALPKLCGDGSSGAGGDVEKRLETMQCFLDEWGF